MINLKAKTEESKEIIFQQIFTILKLHRNRRRNKQLLELKQYFKELDFFKKLATSSKNEVQQQLVIFRYLKAFFQIKGINIFDYGDEGSWFYIILKGTVGVKIPSVKKMKCTQMKAAKFIENNWEDVLLNKSKIDFEVINGKVIKGDCLNG